MKGKTNNPGGRPKGDRHTEPVNVRIKRSIKDELQARAKRDERSVSWIVEKAIIQYLVKA